MSNSAETILQRVAAFESQLPKVRHRPRLVGLGAVCLAFCAALAGIAYLALRVDNLSSALAVSEARAQKLDRLQGFSQRQSLRLEALRLQREELREAQQQLQAEMARIAGIGEARARTINSLQQQQAQLLSEQQRLQITAAEKAEAVESLSAQLSELQKLVDISLQVGIPLGGEAWVEDQTEQEKRFILKSVPSGSPLQATVVTSHYGPRKHPLLHNKRLHAGIDFRAAKGTPVYATADGLVEWAGAHDSGLGTMVKLVHHFGFTSTYGHLQKVSVSAREYVAKGDLIGFSGSSGLSTGPHLHYEVGYLYKRLNPQPFLEWSLENYTQLFDANTEIHWEALAQTVRRQLGLLPEESVAALTSVLATGS